MSKATIKTLAAKRSELVREIEEHQAAIRQKNSDIDSIDAALRLFGAPIKKHETVFPKFRKELARMVMEMLREAGGPLTALTLAEKVLLARHVSPDDEKLVKAIQARVRGILMHYREKGLLVSRENVHSQLEWSIV